MPFKSDAQRRFLWSQKPEVAKKFAEHHQDGGMAGMDHVKKITQKDRYGNQVSYEFENPVKPLDQTAIVKQMMEDSIPEIEIPEMYDHPGEPKGTDTVPAWLTPGEFVVNKEATEIYGDEIKAMNDHGRELQAAKGMEVPHLQKGGDSWWNKRMAGIPQHTGYIDDPDNIAETVLQQDPYGGKYLKDIPRPGHYVDQATYYIPKRREYVDEAALRAANNAALKAKAEQIGFKFQQGGNVPFIAGPMLTDPKFMQEGGWITDALLDRLAEVESGGNNKAVSPAGAVGMYQWLPSSAKQAGYGVKPFDPLDTKAARAATAKYLKNMQKHHGFTPEETLRAYNWGPGNVINYNKGKRKDIPAEALNYPGKILGFENVEGVNVPYEMPVPTPRPRENMAEDPGMWDQFKALFKQDGGPIYQDAILRNYPPVQGAAPDYTTGQYDVPNPNVVPEIKPGGHVMFGGDQNLGGQQINDPIEENAMAEMPGPRAPEWYDFWKGHKLKEDQGIALDENEQRLATDDYKEYHAFNPSLVGDDPVAELGMEGIDETGETGDKITGVTGEALVGQVDDMDPKFKKEVKEETIKKIDEETKDAQSVNEDDKTIEKKAKENPDEIAKAEGFLKGILGDLFDTKELKRAAVMYVGSRLLGYDHQGSLRHSMKNYVSRVDAKVANKEKTALELTKTGKYTPASIQAFKESGNVADLQAVGVKANALGNFKTFFKGGKQVRAQEYKVGDSKVWQTADGKIVDSTYSSDPASVKGTPQYGKRIKEDSSQYTKMIEGLRTQFGTVDTGDGVEYKTELAPAIAGNKIAKWAVDNGVPPEYMGSIVENAYHSALSHTQNTGEKVRDLTPFLEEQYVVAKVGDASLFKKEDGKPVSGTVVSKLIDSAQAASQKLGGKTTQQDILEGYRKAWNDLSEKERKHWNAQAGKEENGFVKFMQTDIYKTL